MKHVTCLRFSRTLAILLPLTLIVFQEVIVKAGFSFFAIYDELITGGILVYILFVCLIKKAATQVEIFLILSLGLAIVISLFGYQPDKIKVLVQCFIHFKLIILYVGLRRLLKNNIDSQEVFFVLDLWFGISAVGFLLNVILQEHFYDLLNATIKERGGFLRIEGFQLKPNDLAIFLAYYYIYIVLAGQRKIGMYGFVFWTVVISSMILMNGSRTALVAVMLTVVVYLSRKSIVVFLAIAVPVILLIVSVMWESEKVAFLVQETIKNVSEFGNIDQSMYIRGIMIYNGIVLALKYFPFGTGAATFGSVMSADSPVYEMLGLSSLRFFEDMEGVFDSNFGTIMGEFGVVGMIWFVLALRLIFKDAKRLSQNSSDFNGFGWVMMIYSGFVFITNPLFMYQYNGLIFSYILLCGAHSLGRRV